MTDNLIHKIGKLSHTAATTLHVRSALNPLLWLTAISTPLCFGTAYIFKNNETISTLLVRAGLIPIMITCLGFVFFALFKPEKLQSEDYQIRHESLQIIQQKSGNIEVAQTSIDQIANPMAVQLKSRENKK